VELRSVSSEPPGPCQTDPLAALAAVVADDWDESCMRWARAGMATWLRAGGRIPLERCLRLPKTPAKLRQAIRDSHLRQAASLIDASTPYARARALEREIAAFMRCAWPAWRECSSPPPGTSRLREALFHALKAGDEAALSARQLATILGSVSGQKFPSRCSILLSPNFTEE
jgi:hypothetical protein